jgi:hypothetical protein
MSVYKDLENLGKELDTIRGIQADVSSLEDSVSEAVADLETIVESLDPESPAHDLLQKVINDLRTVTDELY